MHEPGHDLTGAEYIAQYGRETDVNTDLVAPAAADAGVAGVFEQILGTLQYGLSRAIDKEFPQQPWTVNDPAGWQYAVGPTGRYYVRGQPGQLPGAVPALNPWVVFGVVGVLGALAYLMLK